MQTSPTSSEVRADTTHAIGAVRDVVALVGHTPLYTLGRSGGHRAHVKLEGENPGGSYFDRVAAAQLIGTGAGDFAVVSGATAFAASAAMLCARRGVALTVVAEPTGPRRLHELLRRLGAEVVTDEASERRVARAVARGAIELRRDDVPAHLHALRAIGREVRAALDRPFAWVVVEHGVPKERVARALAADLGVAEVAFIADDDELPRALGGSAASRRTQMGHREGILLGPVATEVVDRTIELAEDGERDVVGIVPDAGHRFLGWW